MNQLQPETLNPFNNPLPVAMAIVPVIEQDGSQAILCIRRGDGNGKGMIALPGGYLRPKETLEAAAKRELREECKSILYTLYGGKLTLTKPKPEKIIGSAITNTNRLLMFVLFEPILFEKQTFMQDYFAAAQHESDSREVDEFLLINRKNFHCHENNFFCCQGKVIKSMLDV